MKKGKSKKEKRKEKIASFDPVLLYLWYKHGQLYGRSHNAH